MRRPFAEIAESRKLHKERRADARLKEDGTCLSERGSWSDHANRVTARSQVQRITPFPGQHQRDGHLTVTQGAHNREGCRGPILRNSMERNHGSERQANRRTGCLLTLRSCNGNVPEVADRCPCGQLGGEQDALTIWRHVAREHHEEDACGEQRKT